MNIKNQLHRLLIQINKPVNKFLTCSYNLIIHRLEQIAELKSKIEKMQNKFDDKIVELQKDHDCEI